MLRHVVAAAVLAIGTVVLMPEPSDAGVGGIRGGGGFRAPVMMHRHPGAGMLRHGPRAFRPHGVTQLRLPAAPRRLTETLARTTVRAPFARLERRHHHRFVGAYVYPSTTYGDDSYIGIPYDPIGSIPVYAPPSITELADPPSPPDARLSGSVIGPRELNGEACRAERVTVPAAEGERAITVVRC
jgi:hypothetical protein